MCESREQAKRLILAGEVSKNGAPCSQASASVKPDDVLTLKTKPRYVSRGGLKLEGALAAFGVDAAGKVCLDIGASTGGFTDCLLQHGAKFVHTVDCGTNQLAWKIRDNRRVQWRENFNARHLQVADIGEPVDLVVIDVSFISLTLILPAAARVLKPMGDVICLIKPQFEAGRGEVGKGGIIRDAAIHAQVVEKIRCFATEEMDWEWRGLIPSPIQGGDGNVEFLAWLRRAASPSHSASGMA